MKTLLLLSLLGIDRSGTTPQPGTVSPTPVVLVGADGGNVFPRREAIGASCVEAPCVVLAGEGADE